MRDVEANRIDGPDIKPLWLLQKIPSPPGIVLEGVARQLQLFASLLLYPELSAVRSALSPAFRRWPRG